MTLFEFNINLDRVAEAIERIAQAVERLAPPVGEVAKVEPRGLDALSVIAPYVDPGEEGEEWRKYGPRNDYHRDQSGG